jgi:DNA-binding CsgD family transcriptional regulator
MYLPMVGQTVAPCLPDFYTSGAECAPPLKGEEDEVSHNRTMSQTMAKLKLSHTPAEHQLYQALLDEAVAASTRICAFSTRRLMMLAQMPNYSAVRRALHGLISKLSIEDYRIAGDLPSLRQATVYLIFSPEEVMARRTAYSQAVTQPGLSYASDFMFDQTSHTLDQAIECVTDFHGLSRREAQVALCCVEGLTNIEIGGRLHISEQTVKYHLRHIFVKYKVKRRTELVSRLLTQSVQPEPLRE